MAQIDLEEKNLKKKLEELEKKYNESLFEDLKDSKIPVPEEPEVPSYEKPKIYTQTKNEIKKPEIQRGEPVGIVEPQKFVEPPRFAEQPRFTQEQRFVEQPKFAEQPRFSQEQKFVEQPLETRGKTIKQTNKENIQENSGVSFKNKDLSGKISSPEIKKISEKIYKLKKEISKVLVGQEEIVNGLIRGLLCNAHVLLEGVPGIAKTLAIRALASASGCSVKRIQFTVDMLPTDIIGITSYTPEKGFEVIKGPIFANFLIADEINRSPPKTQSALIEGMQEKQVTIGKKSFPLPDPFFVMATENPIENAGVYPLPEAQVDRFLFKLVMGYPGLEEEKEIMSSNITIKKFEQFNLKAVITPNDILNMQELVRKVYIDNNVKNYILTIIRRTREKDFENAQYISYGCSPRASIGVFIASKANALMEGRDYVLPEDVKKIVFDVLRHRLILSYKASIEKINPDLIIKEILNSISIE